MNDELERFQIAFAFEWAMAGQEFVENNPEREDIAAGVSGVVDRVLFREGQFVEGDKTVLVEVDQEYYTQSLQQARENDAVPGGFQFGRDVRGIFGVPPRNVFLVKLSYWLNY